jgi:predicted AAA+ superfamily ATPase
MACYLTIILSLNAMNENIPYIERLVDLNALLAKKSHFLLGPRQTGKTFLIRQTLDNARVYDLLDSETYLLLSRNPGRISEEIQSQDRIVNG